MGKIKVKAFDSLSDQQRIFVVEYVTDLNATRAAKEAGYKGNTSVAGCKLLKNPKVKQAIKDALEPSMKAVELTKERVLEQLSFFLFRDIADFIDTEGYLICSPKDLPEKARQCIDSWEMERTYGEDGMIDHDRWKIKCVSKAAALDLAMKYLKLTGPEVVQNNLAVNFWGEFFQRTSEPVAEPIDNVIQRMITDGTNGQLH